MAFYGQSLVLFSTYLTEWLAKGLSSMAVITSIHSLRNCHNQYCLKFQAYIVKQEQL